MNSYLKKIQLLRAEVRYDAAICVIERSLEDLKSQAKDFLHPSEYEYFLTLQFEKRQHSYLLGRYAAKMALMEYLGSHNPSVIEIRKGVFQQPVVKYAEAENIQVSIAHSASWAAAIAFPEEHPMGIDIESLSGNHEALINEKLSNAERSFILEAKVQVPNGELLLWTLKEALGKTIRSGLTIPLALLELKKFVGEKDGYASLFRNFDQYKGMSYLIKGNALSIVLPRKTELSPEVLGFNF